MIDISVEHDFEFGKSEYSELFAESTVTAFQHPVWLDSLFGSFASEMGAETLPVVVRDTGSRQLLAVLPLMRIRRRGVKIIEFADLGVTDYCAPIVRNGNHRVLDEMRDLPERLLNLIGPCDIFRVKSVRPEHASLVERIVGNPPKPAGFSAHEAPLEAPYQEWRKTAFNQSRVRYIDRKARRFEKLGNTKLELIEQPDAARSAISALQKFRAERFDGDPIQQQPVQKFYADVAAAGCRTGYARTYKLSENGNPVGIVFGTTHKQRLSYLLIGCDYDGYSKHSPGLLMYDRIMADWLGAGGDVFDFTIGDEAFKADFGTRSVQMSTFNKAVSFTGHVADTVHSMSKRFA